LLRYLILVVPQSRATAAIFADAAGHPVHLSDVIAPVLPADRPAAILLTAVAAGLMIGWPFMPKPGCARGSVPRRGLRSSAHAGATRYCAGDGSHTEP
jgi:hypothetical protein